MALFAIILTSCKKYELGNGTLLSKNSRLCNNWILFEITDRRGQVFDSVGYGENLILDKDGVFEKKPSLHRDNVTTPLPVVKGIWRFAFDKQSLVLFDKDNNTNYKYTIRQLSSKELMIYDESLHKCFHYLTNG